MNKPTGISRRIEQCIQHIQTSDWEGALVNLFPALDKTAKKRRPRDGVGKRIHSFLEDEEALISAIATGNIITQCYAGEMSITDALYKFGRTSIAHEGELDPKLKFNDSGEIKIKPDEWNLPSGYIMGMSIVVIIAPENQQEYINDLLAFNLLGQKYQVNSLWGQKQMIQQLYCDKFKNPNLFERE